MKTHRVSDPAAPRTAGTGQAPSTEAVRAARLVLSRDMTVPEGFHAIVANCAMQIRGNEAGVAQSDDPEAIHQMRVGLRRLRCAQRLFRDIAVPSASLMKEIGWLSAQLSDVRDWEVLSTVTLPLVEESAAENSGITALRAAVAAIAREKRKKALAAVTSPRFSRAMTSLDAWIRKLEKLAAAFPVMAIDTSVSESIEEFAGRMLARERKRLLKRGSDLRAGDAALRHRLRITAKRARYATEFFESLYPAKRMKAFLLPLLELQDSLGRQNDFAVADRLLREMKSTNMELVAGACYARGFLASEAARLDRQLEKRWKRVKRSDFPAPRG